VQPAITTEGAMTIDAGASHDKAYTNRKSRFSIRWQDGEAKALS